MTLDVEKFRQDAHRIEKWSVGWVVLSLATWGWFIARLQTENDQRFGRYSEDTFVLAGILPLAIILTIIAAATIVYAQVLFRLARRARSAVE